MITRSQTLNDIAVTSVLLFAALVIATVQWNWPVWIPTLAWSPLPVEFPFTPSSVSRGGRCLSDDRGGQCRSLLMFFDRRYDTARYVLDRYHDTRSVSLLGEPEQIFLMNVFSEQLRSDQSSLFFAALFLLSQIKVFSYAKIIRNFFEISTLPEVRFLYCFRIDHIL